MRKVRLHLESRNDQTESSLKFERFLAASDLNPALPPEAILCVRHLSVSMPSAMRRPETNALMDRTWEHDVNERLREIACRAARPARGFCQTNADAIWFADLSELLACLATAVTDGRSPDEWWWRAMGATFTWSEFWKRHPTFIPAAVQVLAEQKRLDVFARSLDLSAMRNLCRATADAFAVRDLFAASGEKSELAFANEGTRSSSDSVSDEMISDREESADKTPSAQPTTFDSFEKIVPEFATFAASPDVAAFVVWLLLLHRAPAVVRRASFVSEFRFWAGTLDTPVARAAPRIQRLEQSFDLTPTSERNAPAQAASYASESNSATLVVPSDKHFVVEITNEKSFSPNVCIAPESIGSPDSVSVVRTEFGGLFYLVNALIHLGWYSDFTQPRRCDPALSIWDFMALLGERTFGEELKRDNLWPALADFAGRKPDQPPGFDFTATESWLSTNDDSPAPRNQFTSGLRGWLEWHAAFLDARLQRAFGGNSMSEVWNLLCRHSARVTSSATHVECIFSLARHPLQIRFAGLDRDPGWVPSAGRHIHFVYE